MAIFSRWERTGFVVFKKLTKSSALVLIPGLFWAGYVLTYVFQGYSSFHAISETEIDQKIGQMKFVEKHAQTILMTEDLMTLSEYLNEALQLHFIDYAVINKSGQRLYANFNIKKLEKIELDSFPSEDNVFITRDDTILRTRILDYEMLMGLKTNALNLTFELVSTLKSTILLDIATVTSMVLLITWLILKDVISLTRLLENGAVSARLAETLKSRLNFSREGDTLLRTTLAFDQNLKKTQASQEKLASTTSPAVLHEIQRGTPLGTRFQALVIRVDLNNYTQFFVSSSQPILEQFLSSFFARSAEIINRYDGLIYQHVGDEIIFHLKESDAFKVNLAVGCIRALFSEAEKINADLNLEPNQRFTLKACISRGEMRFHQLHKDHGFLGVPLIESARILSLVKNKSLNTLILTDEIALQSGKFGSIQNTHLGVLKGLDVEIKVHEFATNQTLGFFLTANDWQAIETFRSDADFRNLILWAKSQWKQNNIEPLRAVLLYIQRISILSCERETVDLIYSSIADCYRNLPPTSLQNAKDFASAMWLSLAVSFVPADHKDDRLIELFVKYMDHPDPRVQAHAVAGLSRWGYHIQGLEKRVAKTHGRLWAEVVFALSKIDFNSTLYQTLSLHKDARNPESLKRAAFVAKQILTHYRLHDPVRIESNPYLRALSQDYPEVLAAFDSLSAMTTKDPSNLFQKQEDSNSKPQKGAA